MARETKLGLGLAGIFLLLVGGVLVYKLYLTDDSLIAQENPPVGEPEAIALRDPSQKVEEMDETFSMESMEPSKRVEDGIDTEHMHAKLPESVPGTPERPSSPTFSVPVRENNKQQPENFPDESTSQAPPPPTLNMDNPGLPDVEHPPEYGREEETGLTEPNLPIPPRPTFGGESRSAPVPPSLNFDEMPKVKSEQPVENRPDAPSLDSEGESPEQWYDKNPVIDELPGRPPGPSSRPNFPIPAPAFESQPTELPDVRPVVPAVEPTPIVTRTKPVEAERDFITPEINGENGPEDGPVIPDSPAQGELPIVPADGLVEAPEVNSPIVPAPRSMTMPPITPVREQKAIAPAEEPGEIEEKPISPAETPPARLPVIELDNQYTPPAVPVHQQETVEPGTPVKFEEEAKLPPGTKPLDLTDSKNRPDDGISVNMEIQGNEPPSSPVIRREPAETPIVPRVVPMQELPPNTVPVTPTGRHGPSVDGVPVNLQIQPNLPPASSINREPIERQPIIPKSEPIPELPPNTVPAAPVHRDGPGSEGIPVNLEIQPNQPPATRIPIVNQDDAPIVPRTERRPDPLPTGNGVPVRMRNPQLSSPPAPASKAVSVESFDIETYIAMPDDTFASISHLKYRDDKYGPALGAFNRERNPRMLSPVAGKPVYLPPKGYLDRNFGDARAPMAEPNSSDAQSKSLGKDQPVPPASKAPGDWAPPVEYKEYRVGADETLWQIAKHALGNGNRWHEIAQLNKGRIPDVNRLQAGTILRLPGDAQVDAAH